MRVYLAAPYETRDAVRDLALELERVGFTITSSWLHEQHTVDAGSIGPAAALTEAEVRAHCATDFHDIDRAEVLVVFTSGHAHLRGVRGVEEFGFGKACFGHSGGRHIETGYALAQRKPVFVVGEPENVFHRGLCTAVPTWHELVLALVEHRQSVTQARTHEADFLTYADVRARQEADA